MPSVALLWVLGVVVAAVRWWFSHDRTMFHMAPDEPAQLAMARWISGGTRWNLFDHATWRPGMATLMAPLFWFSDEPATIMHGGLLIAAALGGIGAVLLARLGARLTVLPPMACVLASGAIAISAASLSATAFVWAEGLATVCFLATLTWLLRFYDRPTVASAMATLVAVTAACIAHSRLLPLVPVILVLLLAGCVYHRRWMLAIGVTVVAGLGTLLSFVYTGLIYDHVYDKPGSSNTIGTVAKRLPHVLDNLRSALGQSWYQLIATAGLTMIGSAVLLARAVRRRGIPARVIRDARLVILVTLPLVLVSMVFMSGRTRTDHRIYGRYNDGVLWPVLLIAIAWLVNLRRTPYPKRAAALLLATVAAMIGAGFGIHAAAGEAMAKSAGVRPMVAGLMPMLGLRSTIDITRVTIIAVASLLLLVAAALLGRRGWLLIPVLGAMLAFGGWRTHEAMAIRLNSWEPATEVTAIDEFVPPGATLGVKFVLEKDDPPVSWDDQRRRAQIYQFALPHHLFLRDRGIDDDVGPYVFAPLGDDELEESGAELLWTDPKVKFGLWKEAAVPEQGSG